MIVGIPTMQVHGDGRPSHHHHHHHHHHPSKPPSEGGSSLEEGDPSAVYGVVAAAHESPAGGVAPQLQHPGVMPLPPHQVYLEQHGLGQAGAPQQVVMYPPPQYSHHPHHPHHHPPMSDVAVLTSQFQALGMPAQAPPPQHHGAAAEAPQMGDSEMGDDNDGTTETEEDPVKLFVGQVPKKMSEEDIFPTFDAFGPLKDVAIIRDKTSGMHRGCAFVTYWNLADAERAQEALHDKYTFPGGRKPTQVKPAEPSGTSETKLFIGMLSRKAGEEEVRDLFAPFGEIREIHMIRSSDGSSKCAAFLRFVQHESAVQAIETLNNIFKMDGSSRPLIVKFADNKHQKQARQIRNMRKHEMMAVMAPPNGYAPYPPPPPHGPPLAMPPMHHPPQYPMHPPQFPGAPYGPTAHPHAFMFPHQFGPAPPPPYAYEQQRPPVPTASSHQSRPREGPAGANLFVYHLPHDLTDADLATAFNPFGNVISAKVYVDKYTAESKGFGFVSYDSVIAAESAIEQMNGFQIGNKRLKVQHKRVHGTNPNLPPHDPDRQPPSFSAPEDEEQQL